MTIDRDTLARVIAEAAWIQDFRGRIAADAVIAHLAATTSETPDEGQPNPQSPGEAATAMPVADHSGAPTAPHQDPIALDRYALAKALYPTYGQEDWQRSLAIADAVDAHLAATGPADAGLRERIQAVAARQVKPPHILTDEAGRIWLAGRDAGISAIAAALAAPDPGPDQGVCRDDGCLHYDHPAPAREAEEERS